MNRLTERALSLLEVVGTLYDEQSGVRVALVPGQITTDDWCWGGCGAAYVRLDSMYQTIDFPVPMTRPTPATSQIQTVARFHVGIHRCVHGVDNQGNSPSPEDQTEDALALSDDAWSLYCALVDWAQAQGKRGGALLGAWTPVGPLGDCAGGFWPVTIRV